MKRKITSYIFLGTIVILAVSSVVMTIETATSSMEMSKLEGKESELLKQKKELEEMLVRSMSLGELHEKSAELGFTKSKELVYITPAESVAKLPE